MPTAIAGQLVNEGGAPVVGCRVFTANELDYSEPWRLRGDKEAYESNGDGYPESPSYSRYQQSPLGMPGKREAA